MACLYYGLYAWIWDAPALAMCSVGIPSGVVALTVGLVQINAARALKKSSHADVDGRFCAIKILNCLSMLLSMLGVGISIYLIFVLLRWLEVEEPGYQPFIQGPVATALMLNTCQGVVALLGLAASFAGLVVRDF